MKVLNALFFLLALPLAAQQTGSVRVSVTDPSGAIITEASLLLTSSSTGYQQSVVCGPTGNCEFANVPFGRYSLRAEAAGFAAITAMPPPKPRAKKKAAAPPPPPPPKPSKAQLKRVERAEARIEKLRAQLSEAEQELADARADLPDQG